jgi:hypothetical protein
MQKYGVIRFVNVKLCNKQQVFCRFLSLHRRKYRAIYAPAYIQGVPGGKVNILGGHSIGHSKQKTSYEHVSYSERFRR